MLVEYTCADHVATLTLNRPEKLNAFNDELVVAPERARCGASTPTPRRHVAIIHGKGRAFSSGADVQQRQLRRARSSSAWAARRASARTPATCSRSRSTGSR